MAIFEDYCMRLRAPESKKRILLLNHLPMILNRMDVLFLAKQVLDSDCEFVDYAFKKYKASAIINRCAEAMVLDRSEFTKEEMLSEHPLAKDLG